ncbi:MAG: hypothetical protein WD738_18105 [Pirellulales bacterium]
MKRSFLIGAALLLSTSAVAVVPNEQPRTIPLDKIWAYKMPGTRDLQGLDKDDPTKSGQRQVAAISESLILRAEDLKWENISRPGFAVPGTGLPALRAAHSILVEGKKPLDAFPPNEEITIVFFSELAPGNKVQIQEVTREGESVVIRYQLKPHVGRMQRSLNLALIPLGKLPGGKYTVGLEQTTRDQKFIKLGFKPVDKQWSRDFLCKPFSFNVTANRR